MAKKKKFNLSDLGGLVYSTNPDYEEPKDDVDETESGEEITQKVYVSLDKKHRRGKTVTLVEGFIGSDEAVNKLGKELKSKCGSGGSVKDGLILVQGDFKDRIATLLTSMGYQVKKKG